MLEIVDFLDEPKPNYQRIWDFQRARVDQIAKREAPECIVLCEHELVITSGRRSKDENILNKEVPHFAIERGGDVTLHQPGQLVIYPLMNLHGSLIVGGLHIYLRHCEEVVIQVLENLGLKAGRFGPTGVWIKNSRGQIKKIASIGVAVRRWITYHGISVNISNDLTAFQNIRPCGFESGIMTSLEGEGIEVSLSEFSSEFVDTFETLINQPRNELVASDGLGGGTVELSIPANF